MRFTIITLALASLAAAGLAPRHESEAVDVYPIYPTGADSGSTAVDESPVPGLPVPDDGIPIPEVGSPSATLTITAPAGPEEVPPTAAPSEPSSTKKWPVPYDLPGSALRPHTGTRRPFPTAGAAAASGTRIPRPSFATSVRPSRSGRRNSPRPSITGALPSLPPFPTGGGADFDSLFQQWLNQIISWLSNGRN